MSVRRVVHPVITRPVLLLLLLAVTVAQTQDGVTVLGRGASPAQASPALPKGLKLDTRFQPQFLEGASSGFYYFVLRITGDATALRQVKSVKYLFPEPSGHAPSVKTTSRENSLWTGT